MPLTPGTKLGPYEIVAQIGAGGMGVVYKASDTRLNRTVAIKVLAAEFSENVEMKQRFEREAQTIAALNHPQICTLYDVGRQDGTDFLVMEYLEGESLAQRLDRGALPLDEALKVAVALGDAIDKAHGQGVTHRDLKPGNVMLTTTGVKLLDFGLAKLKVTPQPSNARAVPSPASGDTTPGTILGTMQYMAPEQLEGKEADPRTDIFAFGVLLYEMVSGKRAFDGRSQALLIASIMSADPEPLSKTLPAAPPALDYLIQRCLAKDPEQRLQTAWDLVCQLQWIAEQGAASGMLPTTAASRRKSGLFLRVALAAVAILIAVLALPTFRYLRGEQTAAEETRFILTTPDMAVTEAVSVSPNGRWIAYSAREGASSSVFARPINSEAATKLQGTDGAEGLFWSSDSKWIAFFAGGKLKKVEAIGGAPQIICDTPDLLGGTWNAEDTILFASSKGLQRVAAAGGDPTSIAIAAGEAGVSKPQDPYFLPDGNHYLFTAAAPQGASGGIYAGSLNSREATRLITAQSNAVYADPGYLLYHREGTLYAQPFSAKKVALTGEAIRVADKVPYGTTGAGAFAASQTGILVLRNSPPLSSGGGGARATGNVVPAPLLWVNRSGVKLEQAAAQAGWAGVDLSPDAKRAAVHRHDGDGGDIWIFEAGKDTPARLTFDAAQDNSMPIWSPDGARIAFGSRRKGKWGLYLKQADNTRSEETLLESDVPMMPMDWSPDGKLLVYWTADPKTAGDIWSLSVTDKKPIAVLQTTSDERNPQVSPDGKWMAYSSNETGRSEIYIRSFPEGPAKIQVSVNGGLFPRWRHDGKELYFMSLLSLGAITASDIRTSGSSIQRDVPHTLFQSIYVNGTHAAGQYHAYAVTRDGGRFLIPQFESALALYQSGVVARGRGRALSELMPSIINDRHATTSPFTTSTAPIMVVLNWTSVLKRK